MTRGDLLRYLAVTALCPFGGFVAFVIYVWVLTGEPQFQLSAFVWMLGYPIAMVGAGVLGLPILLMRRRAHKPLVILPLFVLGGVLGGAIVYATLFGRSVFAPTHWDPRLTFEYALIGFGVSFAAWLISSFGPLRLIRVQPSDHASAA